MLEQTKIFVGSKLRKESINTVFKGQEDKGTKGVFEERKLRDKRKNLQVTLVVEECTFE